MNLLFKKTFHHDKSNKRGNPSRGLKPCIGAKRPSRPSDPFCEERHLRTHLYLSPLSRCYNTNYNDYDGIVFILIHFIDFLHTFWHL